MSLLRPSNPSARSNMQLSMEELARLELMFALGQVHSDPATPPTVDRMVDVRIPAARINMNVRTGCQTAQTVREAMPAHETSDCRVANRSGEKATDTESVARSQRDWNTPRTLEELIQIRRSLMSHEEPNL
jgi:hypothetical protein